jgi:hypothetical protein
MVFGLSSSVMLCFTWLTCVFLWFKYIYCFILNCLELSSMVGKLQQGNIDHKKIVLYIVLYTVLYIFKSY